jgi:phosphoribosylformylglycinamidine synthase
MLMVLYPAKHAVAEAVFRKWELDFAVVGKTTDDLRFRVLRHGAVVADLPIKELGDEAPEYDRPWVQPKAPAPLGDVPAVNDLGAALLTLVGSPDLSSRRWVFEQYDTLVQGNSATIPGGDAGIIRVDGTTRGLAMSSDVTPRYVDADPFEGGKQAVAEAYRNLSAVGAEPIAITDNLNFGNPEKPEIMGQFVMAIKGIGAACLALDFPVVSGNVSLYNETSGVAILPTPTIVGVGLLDDVSAHATIAFKTAGDVILLVGGHGTEMGQSLYLRELFGREDGPPPPVDLALERRNGEFVRGLVRAHRVTACHDLSDGGLGVALAEMAMAGGLGCTVALPGTEPHVALFAEDQARYLVTVPAADVAGVVASAETAGVAMTELGRVGGTGLQIEGGSAISVEALRRAHEAWFPGFMA